MCYHIDMKAVLLSVFFFTAAPDIFIQIPTYFASRTACEIEEGRINTPVTKAYFNDRITAEFNGYEIQLVHAECDNLESVSP